MADQRITELVELSQAGVASNDVLPIVDVTASQTKKVQVKNLIQAGFDLADASTLDIAKINQSSTTKLGANAIGSGVVSYGKIQNISATDKILGRASAGSGTIEEIDCTSFARSLLDDADASAVRTTLGLGAVATGNTITTALIADSGVTSAKIADGAVSFAKIQSIATNTLLGRSTAGSGAVEAISMTAAGRDILAAVDVAAQRTALGLGTLATQSGTFSGSSSGTNTGDQTITLSGDVTGTGTAGFSTTIANSAVTSAKINDSAVITAKLDNGAVTGVKLADNSSSIVAGSAPVGSGEFIGQQWFNTNTGYEYCWTGSAWQRQSALSSITLSGDAVYSFATSYPDDYTAEVVASLSEQVASRFFAGPASGAADAAPTFRAIAATDLPVATGSGLGVAQAGSGLVAVNGAFNHSNTVASGNYYKVTVDRQGHVSAGEASLVAADIPELPASKITTGTFGSGLIADDAILASKLANYSVSQFGEAPPVADFIGQFFFNPLQKDLYLWDGNVWNPVGISVGEIIFAGTYNASGNIVSSTSSDGSAVGFTINEALPSPSSVFNRYYVVVDSGGTGTSPAPESILQPPDILLCNGTAWVEVDVSSTYTAQSASNVAFTPASGVSSTTVQLAIEEVANESRSASNINTGVLDEAYGGTGTNSYTKGDILVASSGTVLTQLTVGSNGQVLRANSSAAAGVEWSNDYVGTVTNVTGSAPIQVANGTTTPSISVTAASTSAAGVVQLTDSVGTTSSVLAATATAVKTANDLAAAALPKALNNAHVFVGTTSNVASGVALSGDVSITNSGVTSVVAGSTSTAGKLQLTDSTSSTSTSTAATPNAVKTAYDLANAALPKSGGTMTGAITFAVGQTISGYAQLATAQNFTAAQRGSVVSVAGSGTVTIDLALGNNFAATLSGTTTFALPSGLTAGQSGALVLSQDGTGSRLVAFSGWKFPGGTAPTATTTASGVDVVVYYVESASRISARMINDVK